MKKILACLFAVSVISAAAFSKNFFSQRYFEIKAGTEVGLSNNLFAANDFFKKDLVIDLRKIADDCPENGFNIRADANPSFEINLNIKDLHIGLVSGVEAYESLEFGKDFFDFLGYGNSIGEKLDFSFKNDADIFAYSQADVGFKLGKFKINVQPAIFLPVVSIRGGGGSVTVLNDSDGKLNVDMNVEMEVYSISELKSSDDTITFDEDKLESMVFTGYGFDLGGGVGYELSDTLEVGATCRIPMIPGHLNHKATVEGGFEYNMELKDFENSEKDSRETTVTNTEADLFIHRPLKLNVYIDKKLLGSLFDARAGAGFGVRRPFSDYAVFYPEYYLGLTLNLIDIFKVGVSTQYRNEVFIHQVGTTLNVRLIQFDFGVSTQSSSFKKSLSVGGVGAYAYVTMGF